MGLSGNSDIWVLDTQGTSPSLGPLGKVLPAPISIWEGIPRTAGGLGARRVEEGGLGLREIL